MSIQDVIQGLDYLSQSVNRSVVMMNNVFVLILELLIVFTVRLIYLFTINGIAFIKTKPEHVRQKTIMLNHLGFEISLALVISWLIMMVISSVELNYVVNLIISPIVGSLGGIALDEIYILPRQDKSLYNVVKDTAAEPLEHADKVEAVIITASSDSTTHDSKQLYILPDDLAKSESFNTVVIQSINSLTQTLLDIRESEMIEHKMELKTEMYRCLSNGFVTPAEHDRMSANYYAYINLLKGNGDVKNLYENHFQHLGVHEDRRKRQTEYQGLERRRINNNCEYGQYDNETPKEHNLDTLNNTE